MRKTPNTYLKLAAVVGIGATSMLLGSFQAQAARPTVAAQLEHYARCANLMLTDSAQHAIECSPGHYVDPTSNAAFFGFNVYVPPAAPSSTTPPPTGPICETKTITIYHKAEYENVWVDGHWEWNNGRQKYVKGHTEKKKTKDAWTETKTIEICHDDDEDRPEWPHHHDDK